MSEGIAKKTIQEMMQSQIDASNRQIGSMRQQLEAAKQRELELLAVIDAQAHEIAHLTGYDNPSEMPHIEHITPAQALREHEAKVIEECAGLARDYSDRQGNIYSADYLSLLGSMAEERRKK